MKKRVEGLNNFQEVATNGIRTVGKAAGQQSWNHSEVVHFVNISELEVY